MRNIFIVLFGLLFGSWTTLIMARITNIELDSNYWQCTQWEQKYKGECLQYNKKMENK